MEVPCGAGGDGAAALSVARRRVTQTAEEADFSGGANASKSHIHRRFGTKPVTIVD